MIAIYNNSKIENFLFRLSSFLIILLPWFLVTGPFLPDLVVSLTSLFCLIYIIYNKDYHYLKDKIFTFLIIFWLYVLIRSLLSTNPLLSLESSLFFVRFAFFYILVKLLILNNNYFVKRFTYSLIFCFSVIVIDSYLQYFTGSNILGYKYHGERLSGFFGQSLILGSYLSRLFPLFFGLIFLVFSKNVYVYSYSLLLLVLSDLIIYLSGERVAFFYLLLSTLLIVLLSDKWIKIRLFTFVISILIIFVTTSFNDQIKKRMVNLTYNQIINKTVSTDEKNTESKFHNKFNVFSNEHEKIYITSLNIFKENVIFGVGPKLFRYYCKKEEYIKYGGCRSHSHNFYLQLLTETGIVGFLFIISIFMLVSFKLLKQFINKYFNKKQYLDDFTLCILIACFINFFPIIPHGNFFNNWLNIIIILPICFYSFKKKI